MRANHSKEKKFTNTKSGNLSLGYKLAPATAINFGM
jgi:hypothetical protein